MLIIGHFEFDGVKKWNLLSALVVVVVADFIKK